MDAARLGRELKSDRMSNWHDVRDQIMLDALRAKFT
jgi:predicted NAD-dependent protein-ADP-ribosyltransferase YbiA (DUF1768 family)